MANADQQSDRIFGILFESALTAEINRTPEVCFREESAFPEKPKNWSGIQDRITNGCRELNYTVSPAGNVHQGWHVDSLDDLWVPVMHNCLDAGSVADCRRDWRWWCL